MKQYLCILTKSKNKATLAWEMVRDTFRDPVIHFSNNDLINRAS